MERIYFAGIKTSVGTVWVAKTKKGVVQVHTNCKKDGFISEMTRKIPGNYIEDLTVFKALEKQLRKWADGKPVDFDLLLDLRGTEFQMEVWRAIQGIPHGKLSSYKRLAEAIGKPKAVRAVGNAVGANPCGIVIPCHRVILSNGGIGGFGGGFETEKITNKRKLLMTEGILPYIEGKPEKEMDLTRFFED
ncbi:MAG: methylated-DNA--[protein]-cysteine S-methyltransferase [Candidatus Bathyarchaeota archaeon]|nr:methylated-DNA--[protein]-cysteine S-methyltransferase [Candidatus Bathyarchaeota archaeon]